MKQGWKIFWIVCAVTALVGIIFCVVGLGLGVTLEQLNAAYRWNWDDPDLDEHTHGASETAEDVYKRQV